MKYKIDKNTVQETLILPLYSRKLCTELYPNLYRDETAVHLIDQIDYDFSQAEKNSRSLMQRFGALEVAMRQNDLAFEVQAYLRTHPCAAVVNLGCGLDNTGRACDNGSCKIYNLDFPDVIALRPQLLPAGEDEDITNETELRKADTRDETLQQMQQRQKEALRRQWKQLARQAKTDLETFSRRHGKRAGALMDGLEPVTFEECDYTDFLRRFGAQNEVLQLSEDEFDLIYYTYGLRTYGNVPLVEPLEYRDDKRIREFVIAIDTSGSVQGDIVQSFLLRTCDVLRQSGSFTERVEIYLIQCDAEVQSVERLTSLDQLHELIPRLKLRGFGGTDFRPVFAYVDRLLEEKKLMNLNGLLYFTDGVGTYPEKSPAYKTAFIFNRDDHISPHVPSWAIRAVLTTDNIRLLEPQKTRTEEDTESWI